MRVSLIHPSLFKLDGGAMFGIIPKPLWEKKIKPDEFNRIEMSLRVVLIETQNKKILIDTGIGDYHSEKFNQQFSITNLQNPLVHILEHSASIRPEQITDIILTHLHFDHVGGLGGGKDGKEILFPNATVHLHQKHYEYSLHPTLRDGGSFHSHIFNDLLDFYKKNGQLNLLENECGTIFSDENEQIKFRCSFGHTPYMIHPIFNKFIYMADLVPMSHHVKLPWVMGYDIEPGVTTVFKQKFYDDIIKDNLTMIFEHDVQTWGGKIKLTDNNQFELIDIKNSSKKDFELLEDM